eukprot:TRINITY_DN519_c0_g2_i1.p1 TRINITY_DN519_c0_g2~~TRINITY_DN519_c0_g2_i1.p1  ORF type:complete len:50 (+),score=2.64 TRINITY_DN519_c0_g2_i1:107-256(+)
MAISCNTSRGNCDLLKSLISYNIDNNQTILMILTGILTKLKQRFRFGNQ